MDWASQEVVWNHSSSVVACLGWEGAGAFQLTGGKEDVVNLCLRGVEGRRPVAGREGASLGSYV